MSEAGAPRRLIAGNWKMNGFSRDLATIEAVAGAVGQKPFNCDVMICPPATLIAGSVSTIGNNAAVAIGAQDCHVSAHGAHTGDLSAEMLADAGARAVIVGHSERRGDHGETDSLICAKAKAAARAGLISIICVGETAGQRAAGLTQAVVLRQLAASVPDAAQAETTVVAYEPVWAIGTGQVATPEDIAQVHGAMRAALVERFGATASGIRLLYGGSVKPSNAGEILSVPDVNGALVGGASLKAEDFLGIISACG